ncbi:MULTISPECIES: trehalose-phosphatase [Mycolicibacterium]|uniref:trehalose-phosphatase n=1 Tax=Mycolicibacterium TaxID=1866885 RepID=UPI001CA383D5|nr:MULTISPECIES: trehalose-phosphatase [Mycolicibacterium]QZT65369.1 trehalose-phosphatase [Mycolicibacterium austroafricanum]
MNVSKVGDLPSALDEGGAVERRLEGRKPAVFLDYDGVLTPIVDHPEDAVMSEKMRIALRELMTRCSVCIITGRDRAVAQQLMGVDDLVVAGSHGFDIWTPQQGSITSDRVAEFLDLITELIGRLRHDVGSIPGVQIEPKRASVAVHYRHVASEDRDRVENSVQALLDEHSDRVALTPGKMVYELKPNVDWDKGKAVLHLIDVLGLGADDVIPVYLGDDITDEDAFRALRDCGIGIFVGRADDPEVGNRDTAAHFVLGSVEEVQRFLARLGR